MTVTYQTPFLVEDDGYHVPTDDDPFWTETTWWSLNVPERRIGVWLHAAHHTNRGAVTWRVFAWEPGQLGRYTGEMILRGERIAVDCWSVRDRTWGPRGGHHSQSQKPQHARGEHRVASPGGFRWREVERERGRGRIQYILGHTDDTTGFLGFVRVQDGDSAGWSPLNVGWLLKDGRFEQLDKARSRMRNFRDPGTGWSSHMPVELVDVAGRSMEAEGFAVSHMCEQGAGSNALMRWEYEGRLGWGEDQDGWQLTHFRKMLAALRACR